MRILYFDCFSGISGDMTVGALVDLGVKPSAMEWELAKLEIGDFHTHYDRQKRQQIEGIKFSIHEGATHRHDQDEKPAASGHQCCGHGHHHHHDEPENSHAHENEHEHAHGHGHTCGCKHGHEHHHHAGEEHHGHDHHEHGHRSHADIRRLIEQSELSPFVKKHALSIFHRIAVAEGKIHGVSPDEVSFHEVGALDSIADIVCACAGIETLKVDKIYFAPLNEGTGWIDCAHGRFPVPAPATLEILSGISLGSMGEEGEFITPTGAAIAAEFSAGFGPMPAMRVQKIGYGLGTREGRNRPNVLRVVLGETEARSTPGFETDTITRIETNIDDLSPEITGAVVDRLFTAGALDVFLTPIQMKKNRPGTQLSVLCETGKEQTLAEIILRETTSFGVRMEPVQRLKLERRFETVTTPFGQIQVKIGLKAGEIIQVAPEFESCRVASEKTGEPLRSIYEAALAAYRNS